jgi:hypothetical protein
MQRLVAGPPIVGAAVDCHEVELVGPACQKESFLFVPPEVTDSPSSQKPR